MLYYMTVITLSTVGFQEVHTLTAASREFTIILIVIGIATLGYGVSSITSFIVEGEIKNTFRDRKMGKKSISSINTSFYAVMADWELMLQRN
jgi:voltage-gated potassium channel